MRDDELSRAKAVGVPSRATQLSAPPPLHNYRSNAARFDDSRRFKRISPRAEFDSEG